MVQHCRCIRIIVLVGAAVCGTALPGWAQDLADAKGAIDKLKELRWRSSGSATW